MADLINSGQGEDEKQSLVIYKRIIGTILIFYVLRMILVIYLPDIRDPYKTFITHIATAAFCITFGQWLCSPLVTILNFTNPIKLISHVKSNFKTVRLPSGLFFIGAIFIVIGILVLFPHSDNLEKDLYMIQPLLTIFSFLILILEIMDFLNKSVLYFVVFLIFLVLLFLYIQINKLTGTVSITGNVQEGQELTANTDGISGHINYQWKRGCWKYVGKNENTYILTEKDLGSTIRVFVSTSGNFCRVKSEKLKVEHNPFVTVRIEGEAQKGEVLKAIIDDLRGGVKTYQWNRGGEVITDVKGDTYTVQSADAGKKITLNVNVTRTVKGVSYISSGSTSIDIPSETPSSNLGDVTSEVPPTTIAVSTDGGGSAGGNSPYNTVLFPVTPDPFHETVKPPPPRIVEAEPDTNSIKLSWESVDSVFTYHVYYNTQDILPTKPKETVNGTSTVISDLKRDTKYYFWVKSVKDGLESKESKVQPAKTLSVSRDPEPSRDTLKDWFPDPPSRGTEPSRDTLKDWFP